MSVPTKLREKEQLGKFNVHVIVVYLDNKKEEYDVHRWVHTGDYLALDMFHTELKVINCMSLKSFSVTAMKASPPENLNEVVN